MSTAAISAVPGTSDHPSSSSPAPLGGRADRVPEEQELLRRYHEEGDLAARQALVEQMLPLVRTLARRYVNRGEPLEDLIQVGCVGLIKAVDRFDVTRELRFSTFAVPTILGEIKRHFRDRAWSVRVSRGIQERNARIGREVDRLSSRLGRSPTVEELADATHSTVEQVLEALQGAQAYATVPLEQSLGEDGELLDWLGDEDPGYDQAEERLVLARGLEVLPPRERQIVTLRFFEGLTQREIADRVGVSQMHVSRLLRRAIARMQGELIG